MWVLMGSSGIKWDQVGSDGIGCIEMESDDFLFIFRYNQLLWNQLKK